MDKERPVAEYGLTSEYQHMRCEKVTNTRSNAYQQTKCRIIYVHPKLLFK